MENLKDYLLYILKYYLDNTKCEFKDNELKKNVVTKANEVIPRSVLEENKYIVKASCGMGRWSEVPWVALFDKSITKTASKGYYIVFLFNSDCSGVYLSLNQGYTYYQDNYKKNSEEVVTKVSRYWRGALNTIQFGDNKPFSIQEITLNAKISRLARGYELGNIVSKYYSVDELESLTNEDLLSDLEQFKIVYHELVALVENNFENQIEQIFYSESEDGIVCKLDNKTKSSMKVGELTDVPKGLEFKKTLEKRVGVKRDYISQQKSQIINGNDAEKIVLQLEKERLLNIPELSLRANDIKHVSQELGDGLGYDILSFDMIDGQVSELYIEVKSTQNDVTTPFFMSPNEIAFAREKQKQFRIYRLFKGISGKWDYYILDNPFSVTGEKVQTEPINFLVLPMEDKTNSK